jgi:hypothetical protein
MRSQPGGGTLGRTLSSPRKIVRTQYRKHDDLTVGAFDRLQMQGRRRCGHDPGAPYAIYVFDFLDPDSPRPEHAVDDELVAGGHDAQAGARIRRNGR